jgi:DNA-binding NarL/FixJ family response regulator
MHSVEGLSVVVCDPHRTVGEAVAAGLERLGGASVRAIETQFIEALHDVATLQPDAAVISPDQLGRPLGVVVAAFVHASARSGVVIITATSRTLPARLGCVVRALSSEYTMTDLIAAVHDTVAARGRTGGTPGALDHLDGGVAARLTARERQVLECLVEGLDPTGIARRLSITASTARTHIKNLHQRLGVHSSAEAVSLIRFP